MIPIHYLYFRDILNALSFFGAVAGVCFIFWCVAKIAVVIDRRHPPKEIQEVREVRYIVEQRPRYPMIQRGGDPDDAEM